MQKGESRFKCHICDEQFVRSEQLSKPVQIHHIYYRREKPCCATHSKINHNQSVYGLKSLKVPLLTDYFQSFTNGNGTGSEPRHVNVGEPSSPEEKETSRSIIGDNQDRMNYCYTESTCNLPDLIPIVKERPAIN